MFGACMLFLNNKMLFHYVTIGSLVLTRAENERFPLPTTYQACIAMLSIYSALINDVLFFVYRRSLRNQSNGLVKKTGRKIPKLLQNKAMRAIIKRRFSDKIIPIYRRLQVLKINDLYKLETTKFMHQFSDKSLPASFEKYFTRTTFVYRYSTRASEHNDYFLPHFSTSRLQRSIRFSGVKIWNSIPCKFKNLSLKKFISEYKLHLIKRYN